jgi:hypothetical protein
MGYFKLLYRIVQQTSALLIKDGHANLILLPSQPVLPHPLPWIPSQAFRRSRAQTAHAWE